VNTMRITAIFSALLLSSTCVAFAAATRAVVHIQLLGCNNMSHSATLHLTVRDVPSWHTVVDADVPTSSTITGNENGPFGAQTTKELPDGFYTVFFGWPDYGNGPCAASSQFVVVGGRDRHLALIGISGALLSQPTGIIAGTLPVDGFRVSVRIERPGEDSDCCIFAGIIDKGAYYVEGVPEGHAFLQLYGPADRWIEMDIGVLGPTRATRYRIFNVDWQMLSNALKTIHGV
jgi:hypothetical protein